MQVLNKNQMLSMVYRQLSFQHCKYENANLFDENDTLPVDAEYFRTVRMMRTVTKNKKPLSLHEKGFFLVIYFF
jgi:hypothetical protein